MSLSVRSGGTWSTAKSFRAKQSGSWVNPYGMAVRRSGVWVPTWAINLDLTVGHYVSGGTDFYGFWGVHFTGSWSPNTSSLVGRSWNKALRITAMGYWAAGIAASENFRLEMDNLGSGETLETSTLKSIRIVGGNTALMSSCSVIYGGGGSIQACWSGDVLGLQALNGTTVRFQAEFA